MGADSKGVSAHGCLVSRNGVTFAELKDITAPALTRKSLDITTHVSSDDQYIVGVRRTGELTMMVNWLSSGEATHQQILSDWLDGTKALYQVSYPDGGIWAFSGYVINVAVKDPVDAPQEATIGIRPTGLKVFTPTVN